MLVQKFESFIFKLCMFAVLFGVLKILVFYIWHKLKSKSVKNARKYKSNFNKKNNVVKKTTINSISNNNSKVNNSNFKNSDLAVKSLASEVKQTPELLDLKLQAKELFKTAMQSKKLNRAEILDIKEYLVSNVNDPTQKNKKYSNDAHCVYSLLKSKYICEKTLKKVIDFIFVSSNRKIS